MADEIKQSPDMRGLAQQASATKVEMFRHALGGTATMREAGEAYLPKWEMEEPATYRKRLDSAVFYGATGLTVDALVGLVFRTEPTLASDLPPEVLADAENVDLTGRHFAVFAKDLFRDAWDGLACVVVDMQQPGEVATRAQERAVGLRPYWVGVKMQDILRAPSVTINSNETLGRFAYTESVTVPSGEYGEAKERRIREYVLRDITGERYVEYTVKAMRKDDKGREDWTIIEGPEVLRVGGEGSERGKPLDEIPVSVCYTGRTGFYAAEPPLMDLVYENIDHYQQRSEHRKAWQYARVPVLIFPGMDPEDLVIAADRGVTTPSVDAKPYYLKADADGLEGSKAELLDSERRMANLGAQMLFRPERSNETATARRIESAQSTSRLATAARALQDCLEEATRLTAKWRRVDLPERTNGRWVTVNQDFDAYEMDAQTIQALNKAVESGNLRLETFLTGLRDGVPVLAFLDPEAEAELLADREGEQMEAMRRLLREERATAEVDEDDRRATAVMDADDAAA